MLNKSHHIFSSLLFVLVLIAGIYFTPWHKLNWGKVEYLPGSAITVTGQANEDFLPQTANYYVSVSSFNTDKQIAVNQVNQVMTDVISQLKDFGLPEKDIQTQNISVNQQRNPRSERLMYPAPENVVEGWHASNSITITLRDIDKASDLTDLLSQTDATNVSGPNFSIDRSSVNQDSILKAAVDDARSKAETLAKAGDRKLGKVLNIQEGSSGGRIYPMMGMAEVAKDSISAPVEPGSETVYKTVTVTFELE